MPETTDKTSAVVKVFKYIGTVIGTTLAMITLLTFFFAPIKAKLDAQSRDFAQMKSKLDAMQTEQLQMKADQSAHASLHGHPIADKTLGEVRDEMIKMQEQLIRASRDIERIGNRQQTQIDQVSSLRAEVSVIANR